MTTSILLSIADIIKQMIDNTRRFRGYYRNNNDPYFIKSILVDFMVLNIKHITLLE